MTVRKILNRIQKSDTTTWGTKQMVKINQDTEDDTETFEDELAEMSDEQLEESWEVYQANGWSEMAEKAAEEMEDRKMEISNPQYAELSQEEIKHHKAFRNRWLDE